MRRKKDSGFVSNLDLASSRDSLQWNVSRRGSRSCDLSSCVELRGELQQSFIIATSGRHLHASCFTWNRDDRHAGEAERRRVAQQTRTRLAVIGADREAGNGRGGHQKQFMRSEKF